METDKMKDGDGNILKVGDWVEFKSDIEQCGQITAIKKSPYFGGYQVQLENKNGFRGDYIHGQTSTIEDANRVYKIEE